MKVRIKKTPQAGEQLDYSLVTGFESSVAYGGSVPDAVKHTMSAVPRSEANVEVEHGETAVGDINQDGYIEHFSFNGKTHKQGGIPVNLPQGTFVYSNSDKLKIKDRKLLRENFNFNGNSKGSTPATISKRFQLNDFMNTLQSEEADAIKKNTAEIMVKNNTKKLGELALAQEAMKGFPSGIPAIAEFAMGVQPEEIPEAEMGGLVTLRDGGGTESKANHLGMRAYGSQLMKFVGEQVNKVYNEKRSGMSPEPQYPQGSYPEPSMAGRPTWPGKYEKADQPGSTPDYPTGYPQGSFSTSDRPKSSDRQPTPAEPGDYTPKDQPKIREKPSSGNKRMDMLIGEFEKTPSKQKATELIERIKENYPEEWAMLLPGYNANGVIDNDFVKKAYFNAEKYLKIDNSDKRSQEQKYRAEASKYEEAANKRISEINKTISDKSDQMFPSDIKKLQDEAKNLSFHLDRKESDQLRVLLSPQGNKKPVPESPIEEPPIEMVAGAPDPVEQLSSAQRQGRAAFEESFQGSPVAPEAPIAPAPAKANGAKSGRKLIAQL